MTFDGNPTLKETMTQKVQTVPMAIKASRGDLGESVILLSAGGSDINESDMLGEIYNFDDYVWLEENACEGVDKRAREFAEKLVRAYSYHDDLLKAIEVALIYIEDGAPNTAADRLRVAFDKVKECQPFDVKGEPA